MGQQETVKQKLFYGWVITGAVFLILGMAYGAQYSFGVFFPSLTEEFKWNRESLAGAFSLYTFMYSLLGVILGRLTDRFGPRIVLIFGSVCLGMGIGLISQVKAIWHLYVYYGLLASWGMSAAYFTANPTIVKWFIEKRGLALGLAQSGLGLGIIIVPQVTGVLITAFGWRAASVILGGAVFLVLFTMAFFLIGHPEKMGLQPDGRQNKPFGGSQGVAQAASSKEVTWSPAEAIRTKSFWLLTSVFFSTWIFVFLPLVHLVIFGMDIGLSRGSAITALSVLGGSSTLGRLAMGFISDRIGRRKTLIVCITLQVFSWLWVMGTNTSWMLLFFAAAFGFSYGGASTLFPAIVGDYFGRLQAASVIGIIFAVASPSAAIGPLIAGYIHDVTGGYHYAFLLGVLTNLLSLTLMFISKPPQRKP